jgi:hypothetical protein
MTIRPSCFGRDDRIGVIRLLVALFAIYQTAVVVFTTNVVDAPTEVVDSDART